MDNNQRIVLYAVGGVFVLLLIYPLRDYLVIAFVSAGTVYLYSVSSRDKGRR